jgi:hypothetical protein
MSGKDYSLPGAVMIVVSQVISSFQSSENIKGEIEKFRKEVQQMVIDRETYFVRKTELALISNKIDRLNEKMGRVSEQIKNMRSEQRYSMNQEREDEIIGCSFKPKKRPGI